MKLEWTHIFMHHDQHSINEDTLGKGRSYQDNHFNQASINLQEISTWMSDRLATPHTAGFPHVVNSYNMLQFPSHHQG
jgi:hypothetical protein